MGGCGEAEKEREAEGVEGEREGGYRFPDVELHSL